MSGVFTRYKGCIEVPQIEDIDTLSAKFEVRDNADIGTPQHAQIMAKIESHYHLDSPFTHNTGLAAWGRRHFTTERGILGLGSDKAYNDDETWPIYGSHVPFLLRPNDKGQFGLMGECYEHEFMKGEMLDEEYGLKDRMTNLESIWDLKVETQLTFGRKWPSLDLFITYMDRHV